MLPSGKKPCRACPFRRRSSAGYLGESTPGEFLAVALSDQDMPCHLTVDYEDPDWHEHLAEASRCAGRSIFLANQLKLPRARELAEDVKRHRQDKKNVLASAEEFRQHHGGD